jgi:hypothetical protein
VLFCGKNNKMTFWSLLEVESENYLGIYLSKGTATVVCLGSQGGTSSPRLPALLTRLASRDAKAGGRQEGGVVGCFSVSVDKHEQASQPAFGGLASLIARGCAERNLEFSEVAVALDCAMFMQHSVHSEFSDQKRIAATVRFDTEEALATDITDVAIAFRTTSTGDKGSNLTVFTAQRKILSAVLGALQSNNIDPVVIEPDVSCLSRFVSQKVPMSEGLHPLFALLSGRRGYLIVPPLPVERGAQRASRMRTFLVGAQQRGELVAREVLVTTALVGGGLPINCLKVFDSTGSVNCQQLGERVGIETSDVDLTGSVVTDPQTLAGCADPVDFAIAYGVALAHLEKAPSANFRSDFMPYQGRMLRLQKTLKFAAISVAVLLIALGLYFQAQLMRTNRDRARLRAQLAKDYAAVMLGEKLQGKTSPAKKLANELRHIRDVKSGLSSVTGEEPISSKLTLVFGALNNCAAETNLDIESISIAAKSISVIGSTSSRTNTLKLFEAFTKGGLEILQQVLSAKGPRDNFSITVQPKKQ